MTHFTGTSFVTRIVIAPVLREGLCPRALIPQNVYRIYVIFWSNVCLPLTAEGNVKK